MIASAMVLGIWLVVVVGVPVLSVSPDGPVAPEETSVYVGITPCGVFDTRASASPSGDFVGRLDGGFTLTAQVTGAIPAGQGGDGCTAPPANSEVTAVLINLVALNAVTSGNLRISAEGVVAAGGVVVFDTRSTLNSNAVVSDVTLDGSGNGFVDVKVGAGSVPDAVDVRGVVLGYFVRATDVFESFSRTIVVPADGTPFQNGTALTAAVDAVRLIATASDPWVIRLEPGTYQPLASAPNFGFILHSNIHLEGAGAGVTTITRNLRLDPGTSLQRVTVDATTSPSTQPALEVFDGVEFIADVDVVADGIGVATRFGADVQILNSHVESASNYGVFLNSGTAGLRIVDSTISGTDGVYLASTASSTIIDSTVTANATGGYGVYASGDVRIDGSTIIADDGDGVFPSSSESLAISNSSVRARGIGVGSRSDLTIRDSSVEAGDIGVENVAGSASVERTVIAATEATGAAMVLGNGSSAGVVIVSSALSSAGTAFRDDSPLGRSGSIRDTHLDAPTRISTAGVGITCQGVSVPTAFFPSSCPP